MASNPNPTRISEALWWFWTEFDKFEPSAKYGGTYAPKGGYHNYRSALKKTDYSVEDIANDRVGSSSKCSAIDLTLSDSAMVKYSKRLEAAMRARDKRLFIGGAPILREYIGTKDNRTVSCYVLTGGRAMGVGADSGPDPGRGKSHLWHIHLSFIRKFCESKDAFERVLSILKGETYTAWAKRHGIGVKPVSKPAAPAKPKPAPKPGAGPKPGSRDVKVGNTGQDVAYVQRWIGSKRMGTPDGVAGPKFDAGVKWYKKMRGLGGKSWIVDKATWRAMDVKPTY